MPRMYMKKYAQFTHNSKHLSCVGRRGCRLGAVLSPALESVHHACFKVLFVAVNRDRICLQSKLETNFKKIIAILEKHWTTLG